MQEENLKRKVRKYDIVKMKNFEAQRMDLSKCKSGEFEI